jgi:hypothetical protein
MAKLFGKKVTCPFDAEVSGYQRKGPLQLGDRICVKKISIVDDFYRVIVELRRRRKKISPPSL